MTNEVTILPIIGGVGNNASDMAPIRSPANYDSITDLPTASEFGNGIAQVGGDLLIYNGKGYSPRLSEIPKNDIFGNNRQNDLVITNFSEGLERMVMTADNTKVGEVYRIESVGTTTFTAIGAASNTVGVIFTATGAGTGTGTVSISKVSALTRTIVNAGSFVVGEIYEIVSVGTTDFTLIGAASNTVGLIFTATGVGSGTGTASNLKIVNSPNAVREIDFPNPYGGNKAIAFKLEPNSVNCSITVPIPAVQLSNYDGLALVMYVPPSTVRGVSNNSNLTNGNYINLRIGDNQSLNTNYFHINTIQGFKPGFCIDGKHTIPNVSGSVLGVGTHSNTDYAETCTFVKVSVDSDATYGKEVYLLAVIAVKNSGKYGVVISTDNATTENKPYLLNAASRGVKVTAFVTYDLIGSAVGGKTYLNATEIAELYNAGVEIGWRASSQYDDDTSVARLAKFNAAKTALIAAGIPEHEIVVASIPNSEFGHTNTVGNVQQVLNDHIEVGSKILRTSASRTTINSSFGFDGPLLCHSVQMNSTNTAAVLTATSNGSAYINHAKRMGGVMFVYCHNIQTTADSSNTDPANWNALIDYIESEQNLGLCESMTFSEFRSKAHFMSYSGS